MQSSKSLIKISFILLFSILFFSFCKEKKKVTLDNYHFYVPNDFKLTVKPNDENVLLTLDNPAGDAIIIQNKLNVLKKTLYAHSTDQESLKSMHTFKFKSYITALNGYNIGQLRLEKIGKIPYTVQKFDFKEGNVRIAYDLRIVQLHNDYYAFYSFGTISNKMKTSKIIDNILRSLSDENFK